MKKFFLVNVAPLLSLVLGIWTCVIFVTQNPNLLGFLLGALVAIFSIVAIYGNVKKGCSGIAAKCHDWQLRRKPWLKLEKEIDDFVNFLDSEEAEAAVANAALGKVGVAEAFNRLYNEVEDFADDVEDTAKKTKQRARWQRNTAAKLAYYQDQYKGLVAVVPPMAP